MYPELFKVFGFPIRSFGIMLMIGFLLAIWLLVFRARKAGQPADRFWDLGFWALIAGVIGARLAYILQEWDHFSKHPNELLTLRFEGLTSFGGLIFGGLAVVIWARREKIPLLPLADLAGVPLLVAFAVGRIGCFLNGCCFGGVCASPLGVHFHNVEGARHPAQLYDTAMLLAFAGIIVLLERGKKLKLGQSIALSVMAYGVSRFIYEFFRAGSVAQVKAGLASSTYWVGLPITQAQAVALLMVGVGLVLTIRYARTKVEPVQVSEANG